MNPDLYQYQPPAEDFGNGKKPGRVNHFLNNLTKKGWLRVVAVVAVMSGIGTYMLVNSFADTVTVATVQAESLNRSASTISVIQDTAASGGAAVEYSDTGANINGTVNIPSATASVSVIAKASSCKSNGWPQMKLLVDGKVALPLTTVSNTAWTSYDAQLSLVAGSHTVKVTYPVSTTYCMPILYVDVITFNGSTPATTPPPTVSLSASPTTVSSGQTSTLTWSSVNATTCTGSGAWSGTQPTSGSYVTPALTANSSYTLTCTGTGGSAAATASVAVTTNTTGGGTTSGTIWKPTADKPLGLHWVLGDALDVNDPVQMGLRDFNGNTLPEPDVYDIDGEFNTAQTVSYLHSKGKKVICYIDVGVYETYRSDAAKFQALSPQIWGNADAGWTGSYWLDIRRVNDLAPIEQARMQNWCKDKGFDAIEPDEIDGYANNPGFPLTYQDQLAYDKTVASWAHNIGMSIGQKGDIEQAHDLVGTFDWNLTEDCYQFSECNLVSNSSGPGADGKDYPGLQLYVQANKAVWVAEYKSYTSTQWASICADSDKNHYNTSRYKLGLPNNGGRMPCITTSPATW